MYLSIIKSGLSVGVRRFFPYLGWVLVISIVPIVTFTTVAVLFMFLDLTLIGDTVGSSRGLSFYTNALWIYIMTFYGFIFLIQCIAMLFGARYFWIHLQGPSKMSGLDSFSRALATLWRFIQSAFIMGVMTLPLLLLIAQGIVPLGDSASMMVFYGGLFFFQLFFMFVPYVLICEETRYSPWKAIHRSASLALRNFGTVILVFLSQAFIFASLFLGVVLTLYSIVWGANPLMYFTLGGRALFLLLQVWLIFCTALVVGIQASLYKHIVAKESPVYVSAKKVSSEDALEV